MINRRTTLRWLIAAPAAAGLVVAAGLAAEPAMREIRISAKRFEYTPSTITVKLGESVVLVLTAEDRIHGFKMPDFNLRADIVPGETTIVRLTPDRAGKFSYFCDVFCGEGHEDMEGTMIVVA